MVNVIGALVIQAVGAFKIICSNGSRDTEEARATAWGAESKQNTCIKINSSIEDIICDVSEKNLYPWHCG